MNPKLNRRILIIIAVIVIIFLAAIVWWYLGRTNTNNANNTAVTNTNTKTTESVVNVAPANTNVNATDSTELALVRVANLFTERFGSYSSDAEFQNVADNKQYMTKKMQTWADNYVNAQKAQNADAAFSSVVTKVLSTKLNSREADKAQLTLITQRTEEGANINGSKTYNQGIVLDMIQTDGNWLVDTATWQ